MADSEVLDEQTQNTTDADVCRNMFDQEGILLYKTITLYTSQCQLKHTIQTDKIRAEELDINLTALLMVPNALFPVHVSEHGCTEIAGLSVPYIGL